MSDSNEQPYTIEITLLGDNICRVYWGNNAGGRFVNVPYGDIKDYIVSKKPRSELVDLYFKNESPPQEFML